MLLKPLSALSLVQQLGDGKTHTLTLAHLPYSTLFKHEPSSTAAITIQALIAELGGVVSSCLQNRLFREYRLHKTNSKATSHRL